MSLGRLGGVYALLNAADDVADHWVQTTRQAEHKGDPGPEGRRACASHVAGVTATRAVFLAVGAAAAGERLSGWRVVAGLAAGAGLHYWADRRRTLRELAERVGRGEFYELGLPRAGRDDRPCLGSGQYALDQAWHHGCRAFEAMLIAGRGGR